MLSSDSSAPSPLQRALPWAPLVLIVMALGLKWLKLDSPGMNLLPNFGPWMALAFTGTLVFSQRIAWWVWPVLLFAIDLAVMRGSLLNEAPDRYEVLASYGCYGLAGFWASRLRGKTGIVGTLLGVGACSLLFYVVSNSLSWWVRPEYAKNVAGWVQALTVGMPGYAPTVLFLRNSLLSDLGFSVLLLAAYNAEAFLRPLTLVRIPLLSPAPRGGQVAAVA